MPDPLKSPRDPRAEDFVRRLQEEQSEANDASDFIDPHADDLTQEEGDTTPENT